MGKPTWCNRSVGSLVWAPLECWVARVVCVWILAVCVEQLVRIGIAWRTTLVSQTIRFLFPLRRCGVRYSCTATH